MLIYRRNLFLVMFLNMTVFIMNVVSPTFCSINISQNFINTEILFLNFLPLFQVFSFGLYFFIFKNPFTTLILYLGPEKIFRIKIEVPGFVCLFLIFIFIF